MAFARGRFGIEYNMAPRREEPGPFVPIVIALVFATALVSLGWTVYSRMRGDSVERAQAEEVVEEVRRQEDAAAKSAAKEAEKSVSREVVAQVKSESRPSAPRPVAVQEPPVQVRNLLGRLNEARRRGDVEMTVSTIEQIRALPGRPAADRDDELARELGALNLRRLFTLRVPLWVDEVTVGRGDSASRIAYEHGSTLASMAKLNPKADLERVRIGQTLKVMNHPTFRLLIYRSSRTADLLLNGKFFKRYYLTGPVTGAVGGYELPDHPRPFWTALGVALTRADRAELELLMPRGSSVSVSEF